MKPKVYIETTIISYLTSRPSRDLILAAHQEVTRELWDRLAEWSSFVSDVVRQEASGGDPDAAALRMHRIENFQTLALTDTARLLAKEFLATRLFPPKAAADVFHLAIATVTGMDFLLTWNCAHIANEQVRRALLPIASDAGYELPKICTPEEFLEVHNG